MFFNKSFSCLGASWQPHFAAEFGMPYMRGLSSFLEGEVKRGKSVSPPANQLFRAFELVPLSNVKVVILGQDPYHGEGQAHGLAFSVDKSLPVPPSLKNIFKEQFADLGLPLPVHGCLQFWANQGVLLLNSVLTVELTQPASHQGRGWELFTDKIIEVIDRECDGVVFMLWGGYAQKKGRLINESKHCVLRSSHPSPLSAYRGFLGCGHFSSVNQYLIKMGRTPIDWRLPE